MRRAETETAVLLRDRHAEHPEARAGSPAFAIEGLVLVGGKATPTQGRTGELDRSLLELLLLIGQLEIQVCRPPCASTMGRQVDALRHRPEGRTTSAFCDRASNRILFRSVPGVMHRGV